MNATRSDRVLNDRTAAHSTRIPVRTAVIVGSTRKGRAGDAVAHWFAGHARRRTTLAVDLVDLAEFTLPFHGPSGSTETEAELAARIGEADAVVVVTPEYNHGYPAALKQAIDSGCDEWFAKPVGFVAYGFSGRGLRAVEQLRLVFGSLHMVAVPDVVSFDLFDSGTVDDGVPRDTDANLVATERMLTQLEWWARALREARAERPYPA
ncbi:NADPH-dependent oxidoreductase [Actinobacteria bacterium YIM 96077]|uniref:NADPH-dependent oxidoreductase n=1 Tax=Phytoactinopolyspora halophila TaxID=1981511 RepID=A0A329QB06_9ACTN|nr:NAD(P)H-dependent oxidoreductase [Phytoactinopolyspora halophila]AYY15427.1 NADPH-dependent oxidoreductase [Actinobacteria bacterium YIM 96077]RAW09251.1 NADPH-dependent oxidoreductase [Phytoactinopolyspora halophila]